MTCILAGYKNFCSYFIQTDDCTTHLEDQETNLSFDPLLLLDLLEEGATLNVKTNILENRMNCNGHIERVEIREEARSKNEIIDAVNVLNVLGDDEDTPISVRNVKSDVSSDSEENSLQIYVEVLDSSPISNSVDKIDCVEDVKIEVDEPIEIINNETLSFKKNHQHKASISLSKSMTNDPGVEKCTKPEMPEINSKPQPVASSPTDSPRRIHVSPSKMQFRQSPTSKPEDSPSLLKIINHSSMNNVYLSTNTVSGITSISSPTLQQLFQVPMSKVPEDKAKPRINSRLPLSIGIHRLAAAGTTVKRYPSLVDSSTSTEKSPRFDSSTSNSTAISSYSLNSSKPIAAPSSPGSILGTASFSSSTSIFSPPSEKKLKVYNNRPIAVR